MQTLLTCRGLYCAILRAWTEKGLYEDIEEVAICQERRQASLETKTAGMVI